MDLQKIETKIHEIRGQKVLLDFDLAQMYEVETRVLKQAVRRNLDRFSADFMFVISENEINNMVSQNVIPSKSNFGGAFPFAFTEQGVAMLSSVLKSKKAIQINIAIMRAFVFVRQYALTHKDLTDKLKEIETKYDHQFSDIYEAIGYLMQKDQDELEHSERVKIGYKNILKIHYL
jgi:hypothetical protein